MIMFGKLQKNVRPTEVTKNRENVRLLWLDESLNDSVDYLSIQMRLMELNPAVQFYSDFNRCIDLIRSIPDEQILIIISASLIEQFLANISNYYTVLSIFVFSVDSYQYQSFIHNHQRLVGIFTNVELLLQSILQTIVSVEKRTTAINLFNQRQKLGRHLSHESASLLWNQIFIYTIKQMPRDEQCKEDMIKVCCDYYQHNRRELAKIEEFQSTYISEKAIEWYTAECFLYRLVNKALRTEDMELLYVFRFFIADLCEQLEKCRLILKSQFVLTLYRGTQIPWKELTHLLANQGKIISINGFLSTSRNIEVSLAFAGQSDFTDDFQAVLLEIEIDSRATTVILADIARQSRTHAEEEVLFNLNSLFKIESIHFDSLINVWRVKLIATDEGSDKIKEYFTPVQREIDEYTPTIYFGRLLLKEMGQVDLAEKYFHMLLDSVLLTDLKLASVYNQLGNVHDRRGNLDGALENFEKGYRIRRKTLPPDDPNLASSLINMGNIHRAKGNLCESLNYYTQALNILKTNYLGDHAHTAIVIRNIGVIYSVKNELDIALTYLFRALAMFQRVLPLHHRYIAQCYGHIGSIYEKQGKFKNALDLYHRQLEIDEQCLPSDHPDRLEHLSQVIQACKIMH